MKVHWKYLGLMLAIGWFLGASSGMIFMHVERSEGMHRNHFDPMRERFSRELNLTPDQKTHVDAILQASRLSLDGIFSETRPRIEEVRNRTRTQIRQLLSPEQQITFDKIDAKMQAKFQKHLDRMHDRL